MNVPAEDKTELNFGTVVSCMYWFSKCTGSVLDRPSKCFSLDYYCEFGLIMHKDWLDWVPILDTMTASFCPCLLIESESKTNLSTELEYRNYCLKQTLPGFLLFFVFSLEDGQPCQRWYSVIFNTSRREWDMATIAWFGQVCLQIQEIWFLFSVSQCTCTQHNNVQKYTQRKLHKECLYSTGNVHADPYD